VHPIDRANYLSREINFLSFFHAARWNIKYHIHGRFTEEMRYIVETMWERISEGNVSASSAQMVYK